MKKDKIVIYTNENCPYCKQIKEKLDENKIKYTDKLTVDHEKEWQEITNLTGLPTVPTIYYKDNYFVPARDFGNPEHLVDMLNSFEKSKFTIEKQTYEKLKTLNYNISTAFQRTDQLLRQIEQNYRELFEDEETKTE
jgi:glutaredoxin